ncbi:asparagine synthase (glutamine-hydrolyzing) [Endozoicomonas sp. SM1973]|uniref:asparagine synthase (glutamine-hydrolyzing) n=1 Tax=Spartinivicinus marinus TaxID=2994442 RepID=A0A853I6W5_9GAMM|nr:asparagine synthase (glutamine-hydrolyzing) [Spartinivicinus marinus]MCX4028336.1 asparagine synthase (glutamine-hydrolyzing) [Spartinivicinus marinus]NYZ65671.1 asparagine synthase (glutamine-hydrolyzing) [Spartinivicinus marinus]
MCGITFIYSKNNDSYSLFKRTQLAVNRLYHRGPDQQNIISIENAVLGHTRLSIIDISSSMQPMHTPDKRYWLVFNGEIYNYKELKSSLADKWFFNSAGDTEVILAGLALYGDSFIKLMEGMWAIAFWDTKEKKLTLSRDPFGKKPLYFKMAKEEFMCSSELPALKALDQTPWSEDLNSTSDYFSYGICLPGHTFYKDVKEVLPGHNLTWSPGNTYSTEPYWQLETKRIQDINNHSYEKLEDLLLKSIKKRLVADVEIGAFLSGGIDSSLIVSLISNKIKNNLKTFTVSFCNKSYDESKFAKEISKKFNTQHIISNFDLSSSHKTIIPLITNSIGQPFSDASILPTYLLSKVTSSYVKVALSGDGADEVFSGYQRYQARVLYNWFFRLPKTLRKNIKIILDYIPEPMVHHSASLIKKAKLFIELAEEYQKEPNYTAPLVFNSSLQKRLCPELTGYGHIINTLPEETELDGVEQMMRRDMLIYLPQDILLKIDRASMANSLEVRSPFLDTQLVNFAFTFPPNYHRSWLQGKKILRKTFQPSLPKKIWRRRKQGFSVPIQKWFQNELGRNLREIILETNSPLCKNTVLALLDEHCKLHKDYSIQLWAIYIYLIWREAN